MASRYKEKAVIVTLYMETPRRTKLSLKNNHHHRYHHLDLPKSGGYGRGYNRKAELLEYSRCLRESAQSALSEPLNPRPTPSNNQQPKQTAAVHRKPKEARVTDCAGNMKIVFPNFIGCLATIQGKKGGERAEKRYEKHI
ncbi:hypothetical protein NMG60_11027429, partial [Bertholletia excelsa]